MWIATLLTALLIGSWATAPAQTELVITRQGAKEYHRPGCPLIRDGKNVLAMKRSDAEARGLKPHAECDPDFVPPPAKPAMVYIDAAGKFYHRDKCEKLGPSPKRVTVDEASKKHWPCRTCKPPIRSRPGKGD